MTFINWLGIALGVVILIAGISLYIHFRRKFERTDGFEGFVTERRKRPRRADFDWEQVETEHMVKESTDEPENE